MGSGFVSFRKEVHPGRQREVTGSTLIPTTYTYTAVESGRGQVAAAVILESCPGIAMMGGIQVSVLVLCFCFAPGDPPGKSGRGVYHTLA